MFLNILKKRLETKRGNEYNFTDIYNSCNCIRFKQY